MNIIERPFPGAALIALDRAQDERGSFTRLFDQSFFRSEGIDAAIDHSAESINPHRHTLRGLHYQKPPHDEQKLIRCSKGSIYDVAVDIRRGSPTEGRSYTITLTEQDAIALLLPKGVAHGFLTLEEDCRVLYHLFQPYHAASASGLRFDDPDLSIPWPAKPRVINERDQNFPYLRDIQKSERAVFE